MIDKNGFRVNIAIVLTNEKGKVFWGKRVNQDSWQFPQGGIESGETTLEAMYRELREEIGLQPKDVEVIAVNRGWYYYYLPRHLIRRSFPLCIGQKQKWFLLKLKTDDSKINLNCSEYPEFDTWRWVDYLLPTNHVIGFKKSIYRQALEDFFTIYKNWSEK